MIVFPFKRDGVWEKIAMLVTTYELPETHVSLPKSWTSTKHPRLSENLTYSPVA